MGLSQTHACGPCPKKNRVLGVSYQVRLKPTCSATETTQKLEIFCVESIGNIYCSKYDKGQDFPI